MRFDGNLEAGVLWCEMEVNIKMLRVSHLCN